MNTQSFVERMKDPLCLIFVIVLLAVLAGSLLVGDFTAHASETPFSTEHPVDESSGGARSLAAADIDGDGDLDAPAARPNAPTIGEEINVLDGSTDIPNVTGLVDFGSTPLYSPITKTFTISNSGVGSLTLFEPIAVPAGFSVVDSFGSTNVVPGEATTFTVQLNAAAEGSYSGSLTFLNSDADETPYQFTIQGEVLGPEIATLENGTLIPDGTGLVDFGSTPLYSPITKTFTISNSGVATLTLSEPITVPTGFSVPDSFGRTSIPVNETTTFTVRLDAVAVGTYSGTLEFANDDVDENPYNFTIQGEVLGPEIATLENGTLIPDGTGLVDFGSTPLYSPITKTFTISNSGAITLNLTEPISVPTGFSIPDSFGRTAVPAGETTTFTVRLDAAATGSYSGALEFANDDSDENPYTFTISGTVMAPELVISKSVTPTGALPGATITYTIAFSNTGAGTASGVIITDSIPVSVTHSSLSYTFTGATITAAGSISYVWQVEDLSTGEWGRITVTGQLSDSLPAGIFTNTAIITTTSLESSSVNNEDSASLTVLIPPAEIAVFGSGQEVPNGDITPTAADDTDFGTIAIGAGAVTHTFTISNTGGSDLTLDGLPAVILTTGTAFTLTQPTATTLGAGDSTTFTLTFDPLAVGSFTDTVNISNNDLDEDPYTFVVSGTAFVYDLSIRKSITPTAALPGERITYTLAFSNTGDETVTGVVITDSIPVSLTQSSLSYTSAGAAITAAGSISYVWQVEDLSVGEWGLITFTGQLSDPLSAGTFTNTAEISTVLPEYDTGDNEDSAGLRVIPPAAWVNGVYYATLQDAIDAANPGDEVRLVGGEAIPEVETVAGLTQTGYIAKNLTLRGGYSRANKFAGPADPDNPAQIDADGAGRALVISGTVEVVLVNLQLTGGDAAAGGGFSDRGGGLAIQGASVTLDDSDIISNTASGGGGGVYLGSILTVTNGSVISANVTINSGGGIYASSSSTVTLDAASVTTNTAAVDGGGVYNNGGTLILKNGAHVDDNHADDDGGGIYNTGGGQVDATGATTTIGQEGLNNTANDKGGGVCTVGSGSTLTVQDGARVEGNVADYDHNISGQGGGIYNASSGVVTVDDATVGHNSGDMGGGIYNGATLTVQNGARVGDNAARRGGGIYNYANQATVDASVVAGNRATDQGGGGIFHRAGTLTVQNGSSIEDNTAAGSHSNGGAIYVNSKSEVRVSNSAVISNTAADGGDGGAFYNCGDLHLTNVTVSSNEAESRGGGVYNFISSGTGTTTLQVATMVFNTASDGGGIYRWNGLVTISNTILANNSGAAPDCKGTITSGDYNLVEDTSGCTFTPAAHDITGQDPNLGPLQDNGGTSLTHALLDGSPALEQIPEGINACGTIYNTDQRGEPRPGTKYDQTNRKCEIGAWEAQDTDPTAVFLASFRATATAGGVVLLQWETASEVGLLGFHLYRAATADGPQTRLNADLIPGQAPGSAVGAAYQFRDEAVSVAPGTYWYWLEQIDVFGVATRHGSVSVEMPLGRQHRVYLPLVSR